MNSLSIQHDTCQVGHGGDVLQMWRVVMNMLHNHCEQPTWGGSSAWGFEEVQMTSHIKN
jgi:hypothetical protein